MSTQTIDPYEVLGVPENASQEDVKRAYFRLVKVHRPDRDPEGFERIRRAYEILSNWETRRAYDMMRRHGDEIADLLEEAEDLMYNELWEEAIHPLKHILLLWPEADTALHYLGLCYLELEKWSEACSVFEKLTRLSPKVALYWTYLGVSLFRLYLSLRDSSFRNSMLLERAREAYEQAADIEPYNSQPRILMARTYLIEGNLDEAEKWLEKGISADNKLDEYDAEPLIDLCLLYALRDNSTRFESAVSRLETIARQLGHSEFNAFVGFSLAQHALELAKEGHLVPAKKLVDAALRFVPNDPHLKEFQSHLKQPTDPGSQVGARANDASGCGCACVFVCAIIGAAIGHAPGFLIGAWIGSAIAKAIAGEK